MSKRLLFPQLSREHAIELQRMVDNSYRSTEREQQVRALRGFLETDGLCYGSEAILQILEALAPYTSRCIEENIAGMPCELKKLPQCVVKAYNLMFKALDDCIDCIVKESWVVEVWNNRWGDVIKDSATFYTLEEARETYDTKLKDREHKYVRLVHFDEVTYDSEEIETSWTD